MNFSMNRDIIDELQSDWNKQRPDLDPEAMGVILRIQALAKILGDQTAERLQMFDLQWWQYDVLSALRRQGEPFIMAATELADTAMLTSGAMTNRIDRLEEEQLVRRFESAMEALECLSKQQRESLSDLLRLVLTTQEA